MLDLSSQFWYTNGPALTWFNSYLSDQTHAFHHNTQKSGPYTVIAACHKGQSKGLKELITYTAERAEIIDDCQLGQHLHAEDTQLMKYTRITDVTSSIQSLQQYIETIHTWRAFKRLQLNKYTKLRSSGLVWSAAWKRWKTCISTCTSEMTSLHDRLLLRLPTLT